MTRLAGFLSAFWAALALTGTPPAMAAVQPGSNAYGANGLRSGHAARTGGQHPTMAKKSSRRLLPMLKILRSRTPPNPPTGKRRLKTR